MSFTLLFLSGRAVIGVGGYCAEGGPYAIETHCPAGTAFFLPASIYMGLAAVGLSVIVTRGLGASLALFAWSVLFIGFSLVFLESGLNPETMGVTGIGLGIMFFIMGVVPLIAWWRQPGNVSAAIAGTSHIDGTSVGSVSFAWRRPAETEQREGLNPIDYAVLIPLWLLAVLFGVWVGVVWFSA
ncbi:MAG: hypothetical protein IT190_04045 [Microbacteriaceae bacterium]|nr:hypothetical protein [Microbacteriaceae bacterium]